MNPFKTELIAELGMQFPLIERVSGIFGDDLSREKIPWFFGLIVSAALQPGTGAYCIVLNKTTGTTAIAALLTALVRLESDYPDLVRRFASSALKPGQRVRVKPSNYVYEYEGEFDRYPDLFRLKVLNEKTWRSFPIVDLLRLEPTERVRPKGTGASELGDFELSSLDELLEFATCGNNSFIRNRVLLQSSISQFKGNLQSITLASILTEQTPSLSSFLPWGSVGHDGDLYSNDSYQVTGEPLVAVSGVSEDLALASSLAEKNSKIVFADGAKKMATDLQAFDDIADQQRLLVLASPDEYEEIDTLKRQGCPTWYMSADQVLLGESRSQNRLRASLVGATICTTELRRRLVVNVFDCHDRYLQEASDSLDAVTSLIVSRETTDDVEIVLAALYRILFECSECCFGIDEKPVTKIREIDSQIAECAKWLDPGVTKRLKAAVNAIGKAFDYGFGQQKADALISVFKGRVEQWAVITRTGLGAERLKEQLRERGLNPRVLSISEIRHEHEFEGVVVPAWLNAQRFSRLKNLSITAQIHVLTYPFESKWVLSHQNNERVRAASGKLDTAELSRITGIEPKLLSSLNQQEMSPSETVADEVHDDLPIFKFERRLRNHQPIPSSLTLAEEFRIAQLVQFHGGCFAFLTEWAEIPTLNDLIDNQKEGESKLRYAKVSELSAGDFVLFRASGDKEFTRLIAEEELGSEHYQSIRDKSGRWKHSLYQLGDSAFEIQQRLAKHGVKRTLPTISNWLRNPDHIGPRNSRDIEVIAVEADDEDLFVHREEVSNAISLIRGAHQSAGRKLTQLILGELQGRLRDLNEEPTSLDLAYGEAWVVQVISIASEHRDCPSNQVNRLLWEVDTTL